MLKSHLELSNETEKTSDGTVKKDRVIAQFSSIGSLGPTENNWLCKEFWETLATTLRDDVHETSRVSKPICVNWTFL